MIDAFPLDKVNSVRRCLPRAISFLHPTPVFWTSMPPFPVSDMTVLGSILLPSTATEDLPAINYSYATSSVEADVEYVPEITSPTTLTATYSVLKPSSLVSSLEEIVSVSFSTIPSAPISDTRTVVSTSKSSSSRTSLSTSSDPLDISWTPIQSSTTPSQTARQSSQSPASAIPTQTTTFVNDVHVTGGAQETFSPSAIVFTTSAYSFFTTNGHLTSTRVPLLTTSVSFVPVPAPTPTQSAQITATQSSRPRLSSSARIGIAILGVISILLLALLCIIIRRRRLRKRAFLRLGESF
ncbi:hypothetical protein FB45DRAFT_945923 [Roridomyces roridus]|uniref:Uncharacterized protein n=1 Tax=Roridomyces roridus TaxID=1738132 RepID=A0AAD7F8J1_9AGAR|nr:hypothetical protein FB45DRAFT_945923 [Roridomyces roridus]